METPRRNAKSEETSCRLCWLLAISLLHCLHIGSSLELVDWPTAMPDLGLDDCHDEFTVACANASLVYSASLELCELHANETIANLEVDVELERMQIELGSSAVCGNLRFCDVFEDDLEYLKCISENSNRNLDILTEINYNATHAYTRMREDYDALHRTFLLCGLEAQKDYMEDLREAHRELSQCRLEIEELME
ncbi:uncharacterized protein [Drosophila kikkawai]|uniref:Protein TsetseEP domain-containing protein n=1 Tax=Drosophila kikkawai TaxID=30033 RepID=A0A6P4HV09_DROKI|nr:uncharacterized protein LOC108073032 [Drosophila kikkawai]